MSKKWFLFFIALVLLVAGGMVTHFTAQKEELHLRIGEVEYLESSCNTSLQLIDFQIIKNNTKNHSINFSAQLRVKDKDEFWKGEVRANRMLWHNENRIFLKAADKDLEGCTLLVTRDPAGLSLVYASYLFFITFIIVSLASRNEQFRQLLRTGNVPSPSSKYKRTALISTGIVALALLGFIVFRYFGMGHNPFSSLYDSLLLFALGITLIGIFISKRSAMMGFLSLAMAGFAILTGTIMGGPMTSPMQAILNSPWLPIHVSFIMMAYSLFAFTMLISIICTILIIKNIKEEKVQQLTRISQICGLFGEALLAIGIMVGSVWASMSWGSYWDWDPKETWALLTLLAYGLVLAISFSDKFRKRPLPYHLLMLVSFCFLLMTYFGVNIWFGGKHAYN